MSSPGSMSFHTAPATPTTPSSHTLTPCISSLYRSVKQLPYELRNHVLIYFEEQLHANALTLLTNLLVAGSESSPAYVPPPQHISFISTLLVHPIHTTRATSADRLEVSSRAYIYLRTLLSTTGPLNSGVREAFAFTAPTTRSTRRHIKLERDSSQEADDENINSPLATTGSIYSNAQDFWHCVGWALNCSVNHPTRWKFWKQWLEYVLDVADRDWEEREKMDIAATAKESDSGSDEEAFESRCDSIFMGWLKGHGGRSVNLKRIVRSLFADGSAEMLRMFPEVWENETRARKSEAEAVNSKKRKNLDIEKDNYGDYLADEEVEDLAEKNYGSSFPSKKSMEEDEELKGRRAQLGGPEAMRLRLRVLAMLSRTSFYLPEDFIYVSDLYNLLADIIRPMPLHTFTLFTSPAITPHLPPEALTSLSQLLLLQFIPSSTPITRSSQSSQSGEDKLDLDALLSYLPVAATTASIEDNAKVSLLLETLMRVYLLVDRGLSAIEQLRDGVETGIKARERKVIDRRRKVVKTDDMEWLNASSRRLRHLVAVVEKRVVRLLAS